MERLEQLIASKREQCMHQEDLQAQLSELEQTLERERAAHTALVSSFEDKGLHVELLTEEVGGLQGQQGRAQAQLSELEQTLERERAAHTALIASFEDKGRHVELLTQEVRACRGSKGAPRRS